MTLTDKPFTLSPRIAGSYAETGDDTVCDIEYRSADEKYTVASDVPDEISLLFVAAPDLREACETAIEALIVTADLSERHAKMFRRQLKSGELAKKLGASGDILDPCGRVRSLLKLKAAIDKATKGLT